MSDSQDDVLVDGSTDLSRLWDELRIHRSVAAREEIISSYLPFVRMLAAKAYAKRTYMELEFLDYLQYGSVGLMESVDLFDAERNIKFETFAGPRITGAILRGIESLSEKQQQVKARRRIITSRLDSMKESSDASKGPQDAFSYLAEIAIGIAIGLVLEDSGMYQGDVAAYPDNTYQRIEMKQLRQKIMSLVGTLQRTEMKVITYHYIQQLGFDEIALILGLTKGRISQIHKKALQQLKAIIQNRGGVDVSY